MGISEGIPKEAFGATFRESILLGKTKLSNKEITKTIDDLRDHFRGEEYHIVLKYYYLLIYYNILFIETVTSSPTN